MTRTWNQSLIGITAVAILAVGLATGLAAAFAKLPAGTVENLLKPENKEKLTAILTYHVVAGRVTAAQAMKLSSAKTVNGEELSIHTEGGKVMVNDATVTKADIVCSNGVIHVIDTVLLPK